MSGVWWRPRIRAPHERRRPRVALSIAAVAFAASVLVVYAPSVWPPGLHPRALRVAAASTTLLVTGYQGAPLTSYAYEVRVDQALLAGNVLLSPAVLERAARSLGISATAIVGTPPITANVPAALIAPGNSGGPTDILAGPGDYRVDVQVDPTVPIIRIFTQGPSSSHAVALADSVTHTLTAYVRDTQARARVPLAQRLEIRRLGAATGGTSPATGPAQVVLILFCATVTALLVVGQPLLRKIATYSSR